MADLASVHGGHGHHAARPLSAAEHQAALQALAKISAGKVNTLLSGTDAVSSGSVSTASSSARFGIVDTVPGGHSVRLSPETIKSAGVSAASFKSDADLKGTGHTITMADHTTVTVVGVPHDAIK